MNDLIRARVEFNCHNLFGTYSSGDHFDLVFLRNVLIYFTAPDQERVLGNIRKSIRTDGTLIIGESESLNQLKVPFKFICPLIYSTDLPTKGSDFGEGSAA